MDAAPGPETDHEARAIAGGLASGYEHYLEKRGEAFVVDWDRTTVVLDTNVLLNLYRSPDETRDELLGALEAIAGSLFMPAQVQREFWRNRDSVLRENAALDEVANELRRMLREAKKSLTRLGQGKIGVAPANDLIDELEASLEGVIKAASGHRPSFSWRTALSASEQDTVLSRLIALYDGKVGPEYDSAELASAVAEASSRFKRRVPPGYMDAEKAEHEEEGAGDYLLWRQTIGHAQRCGRDVVLVTEDAKEDWWRLDARSEPINARYELVEEMRRQAGVHVRLVLTADFVRVLGETTNSPVSERTVDQVDELAAAAGAIGRDETEVGAGWTRAMLTSLLDRLRENGYEDRALVIERGIATLDGPLSRADVLEVLGRPADAKLTSFTRAISTATKQLVDEGVLPRVAEPALRPEYDGPGKAVRFSVPVLVEPRVPETERS